jgi:probable F420-dependent oxidoreductase
MSRRRAMMAQSIYQTIVWYARLPAARKEVWPMRFTVEHPLGQHGCAPDLYGADGVATVASTAERCGFDAIAFTEHPAPPRAWVDKGGHPSMDPLIALAFCAAVTRRIKLLTHLVVLPYHAPLALAKAVATTDRLSAGRLILGVGSGYLRAEFDALGVDFEKRSTRFDEALYTLRTVWHDDEFSYEGDDFEACSVVSEPHPTQLPHPHLWIGGTTRAARQRVARAGEGWMPLLMGARLAQATRSASIGTPEELAVAIRDLKELVHREGRDPETIQVQVYSSHSSIDGADFSAAEHLDYLGRLATAGANWFVVRPSAAGVTECCDSMAAYDDEVISNMR